MRTFFIFIQKKTQKTLQVCGSLVAIVFAVGLVTWILDFMASHPFVFILLGIGLVFGCLILFMVFSPPSPPKKQNEYEARRGKSAASVARSMGISRQSFQHFENAKLSMSIANLIKIASALNKHVEIQLVDNYDYSVVRRNINESRKYKSTRSSRVREEDLVEV